MSAENVRMQADTGSPLRNKPSILSGREAAFSASPTAEHKFTRLLPASSPVFIDSLAGLLGQFEPDGLAGFPLADRRSIGCVTFGATSSTFRATTSQARSLLSIARLNIASSRVRLSACSLLLIDQTCFGRSGGFAPVNFPLFQGWLFSVDVCRSSMATLLC
jgi:hypothetical protein